MNSSRRREWLMLLALFVTLPMPVAAQADCAPTQSTSVYLLPSGRTVTCTWMVLADCSVVQVCT